MGTFKTKACTFFGLEGLEDKGEGIMAVKATIVSPCVGNKSGRTCTLANAMVLVRHLLTIEQNGQEGNTTAMRIAGRAELLPCPRQMSHFKSEEWFLLDLKARKRRGGRRNLPFFSLAKAPL
jgi:hypothetical protein